VDGDIPHFPPGQVVNLPGRGRAWVYDSRPDAAGSGTAAAGEAPGVVVLLHGWTSTAALNWCRCFAPLTEQYRVIALDHRGHGRGIRSRRPFRLEDCAGDVAAVIDHLATGPVIAVGYSMGGPVAQLLWQRRPDLVKGLVLCATAARFSIRAELNGPVGTLGSGLAMALSGVPPSLLRPGYGKIIRTRAAEKGVAPWAVAEWERNDPVALLQAGFALRRFDSTDWIDTIDVPTSVVVTTLDTTVEPGRQWHLAQSIPGATAFPVAATHRACVDQAGLFIPALLAACRAADGAGVGLGVPAAG
jgi:3-oxoadipate enol-lactonase